MDAKMIIPILLCLSLLWLTAYGRRIDTPEKKTTPIVLLPIEQSAIRKDFQIDPDRLTLDLQRQLTRLAGARLAEFADLDKAVEDSLVDEAVFELLVTDNLHNTMSRMDALDQPAGRLKELTQAAESLNVHYLTRIVLTPDQRRLLVTWQLIDTRTGNIAQSRSYTDRMNDPLGVSADLSRHLFAGLWRLQMQ